MSDIHTDDRPSYGPGSRHSFYRDQVVSTGFFGHDNWEMLDAAGRLRQYRVASDARAQAIAESRAGMSSSAASGAAFETPKYLVEDWALYLSPLSSFVGQCTEIPDDGVGLTMNLPAFTAGSSVANQTGTSGTQGAGETQQVASGNAAAAYLTAPLVTQVGQQVISQQLLDRAGPVAFDQVLNRQLSDQLFASIDSYVIAQAVANGGTVSNAAAFSVKNLWGDIMLAGDQMLDSAGNNLVPTHFFAQPKQVQFLLSQSDPAGRPVLLPTPEGMWTPDVRQPSGQPAGGATGHNLLGLTVYHDGNIASSGSNAQLVVARPSEYFVCCSDPYFRTVIEDTQAQTLSVSVQAYRYVGVIARHSAAVQTISGASYPAAPTFA